MQDAVVTLLAALLMVGWLPLAVSVLYLLALVVAALLPIRNVPGARDIRSFRIVIPAHNEALVLEPVLRRLKDLAYPGNSFEIVVIADNCTDETAEVARECGVRVIERADMRHRGKGHALAHAFRVLQTETFDAFVVLDADTLVEPNLLGVLNRYLEAGHRVVQAHYDVLNPFENHRTALMYVAFRIFNYVRPLGRRVAGVSTGLKGNGMCFTKDVVERYPWNAFSLAEDIEYTTTLLLNEEHIIFAPEARVAAQMPTQRTEASTQRLRWEGGRLELARRQGPRLLLEALRRRDLALFDWGMDLVVPPLAALVLAIVVGMAGAAGLAGYAWSPLALLVCGAWIALLGGVGLFVVGAMGAARLPSQAYTALLYAPGYVAWKVWIYAAILTGRTSRSWVRTGRRRIRDQA